MIKISLINLFMLIFADRTDGAKIEYHKPTECNPGYTHELFEKNYSILQYNI